MNDTPAPEFRIVEEQDGPLIAFEAIDSGQAVTANRAISEVLSDHGLDPVHVIGAAGGDYDGPHLHGWSGGEGASAADLRGLLAEVAERFGSESFG